MAYNLQPWRLLDRKDKYPGDLSSWCINVGNNYKHISQENIEMKLKGDNLKMTFGSPQVRKSTYS